MQISRDFTTILKGLAIIAIVIHNYPVISSGNVYCNEMRFSPEITEAFFNELKSPSVTIIGDFFKFIGWLGVPIFVFLSGFGLAKKYSGKGNALSVKEYLSYNYLKLLFLLLPAVIFYLAIFIATKDWQAVASSLVSLTLFGNVVNHVLPINPPVYWYFGLTWQLYLIYIVIDFISSSFSRKRLNATMLTGGGFV